MKPLFQAALLAVLCSIAVGVRAQTGLRADYYNGRNFEQKIITRTDPQINFNWRDVPPAPGVDPYVFSVRWTGKIQCPETGTYLFRAFVDDGIRVKINGRLIIDAWDLHDSERINGKIDLEAGRQYNLEVEYFNALREGEIQLFWQLPSEAPVFQGLLGYNDHLIDGRYFIPAPNPVATTTTPKPRPVTPKPTPSAPKKTTTPPAPKRAVIAKDTLEKYLPKNVFFVKSKSIMLPESEPELDQLAGFLLRNPKYRLSIEGHTDHIGNAAKNLALSEERAQTVAAYLTQKGVAASRLTAKGYGDTRPLVREAEGVANAKNRRVEFVVME